MSKLGLKLYQGTVKKSMFLYRHKVIKYILMYTWGLLYSLVGLLVSIVYLLTFHKPHKFKGVYYFISRSEGGWGFEFGNCFLISKDAVDDLELMGHELGHTYQNCIWGPLMPFIITIPGTIRYWYRELKYYKKDLEPETDYDDMWGEGSASAIGNMVTLEDK